MTADRAGEPGDEGGLRVVALPGGTWGVDEVRRVRRLCTDVASDDAVRAVVFTGASQAVWAEPSTRDLVEGAASLAWLGLVAAPVICALEGPIGGAGREFSLACDLRIADASTVFVFGGSDEFPVAGGGQRLARLVGRARALELMLWGGTLDAGAALQWGLISRIVPAGSAREAAIAVARTIVSRGPIGVRYTKEAILRGGEVSLDQALQLETDLATLLQATTDRAEGVRAFIEKRRPEFKGE